MRGWVALVIMGAALAAGTSMTALRLGRLATFEGSDRSANFSRSRVVVTPGETLWRLARRAAPRSDPRVTVKRIIAWNDLPDAVIQPGQELVVPGPG